MDDRLCLPPSSCKSPSFISSTDADRNSRWHQPSQYKAVGRLSLLIFGRGLLTTRSDR